MKLAQSTLSRLKTRRESMKIKLTKNACILLNAMLRQTHLLPVGPLLGAPGQGPRYWTANSDKQRRHFRTVTRWFEGTVLKCTKNDDDPTKREYEAQEFEGFLQNSYAEFVAEIIKYYEPIGNLAEKIETYIELEYAFKKEKPIYDSVESITKEEPETE